MVCVEFTREEVSESDDHSSMPMGKCVARDTDEQVATCLLPPARPEGQLVTVLQ